MFSLSHTVFTDMRLSTTASLNSPLLLMEQSHWAISWWFPLPQSSLLCSRGREAGPWVYSSSVLKKKIGCCNLISDFYKDILLWVPTRSSALEQSWYRNGKTSSSQSPLWPLTQERLLYAVLYLLILHESGLSTRGWPSSEMADGAVIPSNCPLVACMAE